MSRFDSELDFRNVEGASPLGKVSDSLFSEDYRMGYYTGSENGGAFDRVWRLKEDWSPLLRLYS